MVATVCLLANGENLNLCQSRSLNQINFKHIYLYCYIGNLNLKNKT